MQIKNPITHAAKAALAEQPLFLRRAIEVSVQVRDLDLNGTEMPVWRKIADTQAFYDIEYLAAVAPKIRALRREYETSSVYGDATAPDTFSVMADALGDHSGVASFLTHADACRAGKLALRYLRQIAVASTQEAA